MPRVRGASLHAPPPKVARAGRSRPSGEGPLPQQGSPCVLEHPRLPAEGLLLPPGPQLWRGAPSACIGIPHPPVCPSIEAWEVGDGFQPNLSRPPLHPCVRLALLGPGLRPLPLPNAGHGCEADVLFVAFSSRATAVSMSLSLMGHCHPRGFLPCGVLPCSHTTKRPGWGAKHGLPP